MPDYRRRHVPGGTFFFTLVTAQRAAFLCHPKARRILRLALRACQAEYPFEMIATVLLPDHLHTIWALPQDDSDYAIRWKRIKSSFTRQWLASHGQEQTVSASKQRHRNRGVWQRRYWEHAIRDEADLAKHFDYIHYNPVKHRLVECPSQWPHSSFHQWVKRGCYDEHWCCPQAGETYTPPDFRDIVNSVRE